MTDTVLNPDARRQRLLSRAQFLHEEISRLAEDLRQEEGKDLALGAQGDLGAVCLLLERE